MVACARAGLQLVCLVGSPAPLPMEGRDASEIRALPSGSGSGIDQGGKHTEYTAIQLKRLLAAMEVQIASMDRRAACHGPLVN